MQTNKFLLDLGLCKRAKKAVFGFDDVITHVELGSVKRVYITADTADNTLRRLKYACEDYNVTVVTVNYSMNDVGAAVGRKPTAVFAVCDRGLDGLLQRSLSENGGNI